MSRVALVTGKHRGDEGLSAVVNIIEAGFQADLLDRVIFSTWESERERILPFAKRLPNVTFIAAVEPDVRATRKTPIFQSIAWRRAIDQMSDDDVVLKMRTDMVSTTIAPSLMRMMAKWESVPLPNVDGGWPKIFERRIIAPYFNPFYAFLIHDIEFVAHVNDLKKLATMDLAHLLLYRAPSTEGYFHSAPFLNEIPQIRGLLQFDMRLLFGAGNIRRWHEMQASNQTWLFHWLTYLQIVRRYYTIGWSPNSVWVDSARKEQLNHAPQKSLLDFLLEENVEYGLAKHGQLDGTVARAGWWLDDLSCYLGSHESLAREIWEDLNASFSASYKKWNSSEEEILSVRNQFRSFLHSADERCAWELYPLEVVETW